MDAERALRASPQAFFSRERSFTKFSHLGAVTAGRVVRSAFPVLVDQRDGGPPRLPAGERIVRYTSPNIAQLVLPGRKRAVVESLGPMAKRTTSGRFVPVNLTLKAAGRSYVPISSGVSVQIPKRIAEGVRTSVDSVSFTPIDSVSQRPAGGQGTVEGTSVIYANTQSDTDTVAKPTSMGFELSSILRSINSPRRLLYRIGLPAGASLVQARPGGPARIVSAGRLLGVVRPPSAIDASGAVVPVSMHVQGTLLTVDVEGPTTQYQYPLDVDPEYYTAEDRSLTGAVFPVEPYKGGTNWKPVFSSGFTEEHTYQKKYSCGSERYWCEQSWYIEPNREYNAGEAVGLEYKTQGESTVYNLEMWVEGENEPSQTTTQVEYRYGPHNEGQDNHVVLSGGINQTRYKYEPLSMTSGYFNNPLETPRGNDVRIMDYTTQHEPLYGFWTWTWAARVYVAQEESKHPEASSTATCKECGFNITASTISEAGGRANVLYGSGSWLSAYQGAYEVTTHDPGIGVSFAAVSGAGMSVEKFIRNEEGKCAGIQCSETYKTALAYNEKMANGADQIELFAEDAAGMYGYSYATIKVDNSQPYNLGFTGMPEEEAEISAAPRQLTIHATDGKKPTPSSGVRSISVSIDGGKETVVSGASCPEGECTASGAFSLKGEELSEGVHRLVVSAVSNSGVPASKEFVFDVRHASPVAVGPGNVDPVTGNLTLSATDVALAGTGGVSRTYQSRSTTAGAGGPLGPQWPVSVGGGESLKVLPTGSVAVLSSNSGQTTYSLNSKGEFESPKGDENLKMEYKAAEHEYVLKDATAGAETVFEQPKGTESTAPKYVNQFGSELGELKRPVSIATDPKGNMWVTDWTNDRIVEFSAEGVLLKAYGSYGTEAGQMIQPWGIAINQKTGNIYVTDYGNDRIDEFSSSGTFIAAMGWGVTNGNAEYETCTSSCRIGIAGSGEGQFSALEGITVDSSGNTWVVDYGNNRIQEFNETNKYVTRFGSVGSGAAQFNGPMNVATAGGNLYVSDEGSNRIDEFSTTGSFIKTMGWGVSDGKEVAETCTSSCRAGIAGSGNSEFNHPRGLTTDPVSGNLYVTEQGNNRAQEITTTGAFVTKFGSGGSGTEQFVQPMGVVVSSTGGVYVTDFEHARVTEWLRATWWPTSVKGALTDHTTFLYTPVENSAGETSMYPYEVLSPPPSGVSCGSKPEELKIGCRALTFTYSKTTTTKEGENRSAWGEYKGRLSKIMFHGYNPLSKTMEEEAVAQYYYDKQGRLRTEWDPRVESTTDCGKPCSALKISYGYDAEGHVSALNPPGQESWAFVYGTISGDTNTGRLLKVTHAPASATLWGGETPVKLEAPKLSGTPAVGIRMSVSNGLWLNSPVVYGYQWEDCNSEGKSCTAILGATNANYTPVSGDVGHTLIAQVTAINGGGSVPASSAASGVVTTGTGSGGEARSPQPGSTIEYHVPVTGSGAPYVLSKEEVEKWGQKDNNEWENNDPVQGTAVFPPDEPQNWPASGYTRATIDYMNGKGLTVNTAVPTRGVSTTEYNELNEVVRTLSPANRAAALNEGCISVSKKECKSAEVSEKLDTQTEYGPGGSEIVKVTGPEHKVKLSSGTEVSARAIQHNYYDEGAEEAEEKNKEEYNLLTRSVNGALLSNGEEKDKRTTVTSYNGQKGLGWKLRKPTAVVTDPAGLDPVHTTIYDETTGNVVEARAPGGSVESVYPPVFSSSLGTEGSGSGQFNHPEDTAVDLSGNLWVDDKNNHRLQKFSPSGSLLGIYGSDGSGEGQFKESWGIAVDKTTGNIVVSDAGNNRIDVFTSSGAFVRMFGSVGSGNGQLKEPDGLTVDSHGNVWVADLGNSRVEEFSSTGAYLFQFGSKGSGDGQFVEPTGVEVSEGQLYVTDLGNDRVEEFTPTGAFVTKFGSEGAGQGQLKGPEGIAVNAANGDLYVSDPGNQRIEEFSPNGKYLAVFGAYGAEAGQFHGPTGLTVGPTGTIYIADQYNARVDEWLPPEAGGARMLYSTSFGSEGSGEGQFSQPAGTAVDGSGNLWVSDYNNARIEKFLPAGKFVASYGTKGAGNGQFVHPTGIAVNQSTGNVYVGDCGNNRIEELNSTGGFVRTFGSAGTEPGKLSCMDGVTIDSSGNVWVADTHNNRVQEFSATGTFLAAYGSYGTGNGQFNEPADISFSGGNMYIVDTSNDRVQELSMTGTYIKQFGFRGNDSGEFKSPEGIVTDAAGNLYVLDNENGRVEEFKPSGTYLATFASPGNGEGQLSNPLAMAINAAGDIYIADSTHNHIQIWTPANQAAHDTKTIYYTAKTEAEVATCQNRPEWANLPCQTQLVAQPNRGLPELPVVSFTYNIWDETEIATETFGSGAGAVKREKIQEYDQAGRAVTSEEKATPATDTKLPKVSIEYNIETGALEKQSATISEKTKTLTVKDNLLGQLVEYADAEGNVAKYTYEEGSDGRLEAITEGKGKEAESGQTYSYDPTTGFMTKLIDSAAGTFTASYDLEGRMTSEIYPNGMCANTGYNSVGAATSIEYVKTRNCSESGATVWFSNSIVPSIHGETLQQTSTLSKENYAYDSAGRLAEAQETPTGKGCVTRLYTYDVESNRTNLTTREPGTEGKCASEGGTIQGHTYDEANRLTDEGVSYETFGNIAKMPAADAGEHEITSTYYVDNQIATQEQNKSLDNYIYDPAGRTMESSVENTESKAKTVTISHYAGPGGAVTWTSEGTEKWTRNIPGIDGTLSAVQTNGTTPVLQLHDLQGNIVGTASVSESETKLLSTYNSTEFGVPQPGKTPPKYAWLGAVGVSSEPSQSAGVATESGASYVPQVARALQTAPVIPPGAFPDGQPGTQYVPTISAGALESAAAEATRIFNATESERQKEREREACEKAPLSCSQEEDPVEHYRAWEANKYAAELREKVKEGGLVDFLGGLFNLAMGPEATLDALFGRNKIEEWSLAYAGYLEKCTAELHRTKHSHGGCRAAVYDITIFTLDTTVINFEKFPIVSWCEGMSSDLREVHWCYVIPDETIHGNGSPL